MIPFKLIRTTASKLDEITIVDGQIIFCEDNNFLYFDCLTSVGTLERKQATSIDPYDMLNLYNRLGAVETSLLGKANLNSPSFTGNNTTIANSLTLTSTDANKQNSYFSMNRKGGTTIAPYSATLGYAGAAESMAAISAGWFTTAKATIEGQTVLGRYNNTGNIGQALLVVGNGTASSGNNAFRVDNSGNVYAGVGYGANGADFAEYFEWADGNPNNEDRRGKFVTLENSKIRLAEANDNMLGIISATGAFIGNTAEMEWHNKYLTDVFGEVMIEEVGIPAEIDEDTGEIISPAHIELRPILNPEYDPSMEYIPRSERQEWAIVGLLGQIIVVDDGTCIPGGFVAPITNGIGTASESGYRVMERIDNNHIKVLAK